MLYTVRHESCTGDPRGEVARRPRQGSRREDARALRGRAARDSRIPGAPPRGRDRSSLPARLWAASRQEGRIPLAEERIVARRVSRGDIWLYRFAPPDKRRPVLVLSRQAALAVMDTALVAGITSTRRGLPTEVL